MLSVSERDATCEATFRPVLRLFEGVLADGAEDCAAGSAALAAVFFDYGGTRVRVSDETMRLLRSTRHGMQEIVRDLSGEGRALAALEALGAVDLACVDELAADAAADYAIRPGSSASELCAFTEQAQRRLGGLGWQVEFDSGYPYQVAPLADARFSVSVDPDADLPDWFSLELAVHVGGIKVDLLPLILDVVEHAHEDDDLRSLLRQTSGPLALRISDTHHIQLEAERFHSLLEIVIELYVGVPKRKHKPLFPLIRAAALGKLEPTLGITIGPEQDRSGLVQRARRLTERPKRLREPLLGLQATLRPYQEEGVAFLAHLRAEDRGCVLADDMGLGKTLQAIAYLFAEKQAGRLSPPALVVAPTSLAFNWVREIEKFAPSLRVLLLTGQKRHQSYSQIQDHDVVVTTYPIVVRDVERLQQYEYSTIVIDEAQAIKNSRSQAHAALCSLSSEYRICLSGTPVENDLGELWSLFDFAQPGLLGDELSFRRGFRVPIEGGRSEERLEALRELVSPFVLRRDKREVAPELPPKTELMRPVELHGKQRDLYEQIRVAAHADVRKAIRQKGLAASALPILDALMKLRQLCCDPRLVSLDAARRVQCSAKSDAFFELLARELPRGRRVLVFSQFTSMLALLAHGLSDRDIPHLMLTGATRDRSGVVDSFERGDAPVFLISLKAGGTGLNLVSADTVVHFEPWWNPACQAQATDRAYRIGQTKPVMVHHLFVAGSVEERVIAMQRRKAELANALFGKGEVGSTTLTESDVEALFAPLSDGTERRGC